MRSLLLFLFFLCSGQAWGAQLDYAEEICGDGYENVANAYSYGSCPAGWMNTVPWATAGCDKECPGTDKDNDGYVSSLDCNDSDRTVFPGVDTTTGCSGGEWHTCQTGGTYTACSAATYTCHSGSGSTYYIRPGTGSDAAVGSNAAPWATYLPTSNSALGGYHKPVAGDCIVFDYDTTLNSTFDRDAGAPVDLAGIYLTSMSGTASNPIRFRNAPGKTPKINPTGCTSSDTCQAFYLETISYVEIWGLDLDTDYGDVIASNGPVGFLTYNGNHIHDGRCTAANNCSGLKMTGIPNVTFLNNDVHDTFDAVANPNSNNAQYVVFDVNGHTVKNNIFWMTADIDSTSTATCLKQKHGANTGTSIYSGNVFVRCNGGSMSQASVGLTVEKNRVFGSGLIATNNDYPYYPGGTIIQDNYVDAGTKSTYFGYKFGERTADPTPPSYTVRRNVFVNGKAALPGDEYAITIDQYGSDADFTSYANTTHFVFSSNCYYHTSYDWASSTKFMGLFSDNTAAQTPARHVSGSAQTFTTWTGNGFDGSSFVESPTANAANDFVAASSNCSGKGDWRTTDITPTPTPTPAAGGGFVAAIY